jgi:hypothetical protein
MMKENTISDEMFSGVIDRTATPEERRLVYDAIEKDPELREAFNDQIYLKVFEEEIEADFRERHPDQTFVSTPPVGMPESSGKFYKVQLSVNNREKE